MNYSSIIAFSYPTYQDADNERRKLANADAYFILQTCDRTTFHNVFRKAGRTSRYCGTAAGATIPLSRKLLDWADVVVCMEQEHGTAVVSLMAAPPKDIYILNLQDIYERDDPRLVKIAETWLDILTPKPPSPTSTTHSPTEDP